MDRTLGHLAANLVTGLAVANLSKKLPTGGNDPRPATSIRRRCALPPGRLEGANRRTFRLLLEGGLPGVTKLYRSRRVRNRAHGRKGWVPSGWPRRHRSEGVGRDRWSGRRDHPRRPPERMRLRRQRLPAMQMGMNGDCANADRPVPTLMLSRHGCFLLLRDVVVVVVAKRMAKCVAKCNAHLANTFFARSVVGQVPGQVDGQARCGQSNPWDDSATT